MKFLFIIWLLLFIYCSNNYNNLNLMLKSTDKDTLIEAFYLIGETKDTAFVEFIFNDINDPRISHQFKYYGSSVYQAKIHAIRKISGLNPPRTITYEPDSVIIKFYRDWAMKKGFLKE